MGECFEFDEGLGVLVFFGRFRPQESGLKFDFPSVLEIKAMGNNSPVEGA